MASRLDNVALVCQSEKNRMGRSPKTHNTTRADLVALGTYSDICHALRDRFSSHLRNVGDDWNQFWFVDVIERDYMPQSLRIDNETRCHTRRHCLAVFVMPHVALRAAERAAQFDLGDPKAFADRFNGAHALIMSAACYFCQQWRCFAKKQVQVMIST